MRLVPRSLFSRLVLVMLSGLILAQLLSFAVHIHDRSELIAQSSGMQSAQRIADIVRLFESITPSERRKIVQVLSSPPLTISLDRPPLAQRIHNVNKGVRATVFETMLRRFLPGGHVVTVDVSDTESMFFQPGAMHGFKGHDGGGSWIPPMMRHAQQPGLSFIAQVQLQDGALVTFDTRQPQATASWPYRVLISIALLLAAVVIVSLIAVRWAIRPINTLADAAEELGKNINRPPLDEKGPLEVVRAARTFNTMQSRLTGYLRDRTRMLAAMSHDLKTPIARLRLRAELLDDEQMRARFTGDLQEMESMVVSSLDFLRGMEDGEPVKPVDIMALLESLQEDMQETGGEVGIQGKAFIPFPGRPQALKRCLGNLVENAIKYGNVAMILVDDNTQRLEIRIQDKGPGLPSTELEKVFDPFYRVEGSRNRDTGGTGLGLTIARSIAENHGGKLTLINLAEGGLEARLTLPRKSPDSV